MWDPFLMGIEVAKSDFTRLQLLSSSLPIQPLSMRPQVLSEVAFLKKLTPPPFLPFVPHTKCDSRFISMLPVLRHFKMHNDWGQSLASLPGHNLLLLGPLAGTTGVRQRRKRRKGAQRGRTKNDMVATVDSKRMHTAYKMRSPTKRPHRKSKRGTL